MSRAHRWRRLAGLTAVGFLLAGTSACGGGDAVEAAPIEQLPVDLLPAEVLGLAVTREDVADRLETKDAAYVESVGLYSFRRDDLLQATLQASRFSDDARDDDGFRRNIAGQVAGSGTELQQFRMEDHPIFFTVGLRQSIAVWFEGDHFFVLSTRDDYEQPRALLRALLDLEVTA